MINLLPVEYKAEIRAGRLNTMLVRYMVLMLGGMGLLAVLLIGTYFTINVSRVSAQQRVDENEQRETSYNDVKKESEAFRSDLATAKAILDNEVKYSSLIYKISSALPSGVVLDSLTVSAESLGTQATINASAKSYSAAVKLKNSFEKNDELFSDVKFESITYQNDDTSPDPYKYKINISLVINKEAL